MKLAILFEDVHFMDHLEEHQLPCDSDSINMLGSRQEDEATVVHRSIYPCHADHDPLIV